MSKPRFTPEQLRDFDFKNKNSKAILIYFIRKIEQNELRKLKLFEKEHLVILMQNIVKPDLHELQNNSNYILANKYKYLAHNPYDYIELDEATFNHLVLLYYDNLDFLMPITFSYNGITRSYSREEIDFDRRKFDELLSKWQKQLESSSKATSLQSEIRIEYYKKLKILKENLSLRSFGYNLYKRHILKWECVMFYIYFTIKKCLQAMNVGELLEVIESKYILTNYSFVHILSRHYFPDLNTFYFNKSVIRDEKLFDPWNLPRELRMLIEQFEDSRPKEDTDKECMFFSFNSITYIIYFRQKFIKKIRIKLLEIRTLFPVSLEEDYKRLSMLKTQKKVGGYTFYYD